MKRDKFIFFNLTYQDFLQQCNNIATLLYISIKQRSTANFGRGALAIGISVG